jgi:acetyl esterase/lipase
MKRLLVLAFALSLLQPAGAAELPSSVQELWADFDPRREPLETEVVREWREDGGVYRHVRFRIGEFKGRPARMAAIYGFPEPRQRPLPAVMHIHGGGQRGSLSEVKFLVARGYAGLSVNWGGDGDGKGPFNAVEGAQPGDPNTDWAAVDPTQLNARAYSTLQPGPGQHYEDRQHPKNNNWYLLTLGCRRGLTFLEQQPEVDADRLGVHGYSMGGNLTMYVAGTDARVKVAVPAVGGQGWRWQAHDFLGQTARPQDVVDGDVECFRRTLSFESYAPLIRGPVLHRSATNDFHGWMDDVYRTNALIPNPLTRYSWSPHFNHRLTPEVAVTLPLWLDQHLKAGPALPETPALECRLKTADGMPVCRVTADPRWPAERCEVFYSVDPDPRARFWRSAEVTRDGDAFAARLPLDSLDRPVFAFANVFHRLPEPVSLAPLPGAGPPVREVCLSSLLQTIAAEPLRAAGARVRLSPQTLIDDFRHGLRDWYTTNAGHPSLVQHWTRKITDPVWRGAPGRKLAVTLRVAEPNTVTVAVIENEWRQYRGPRRSYAAVRPLAGGGQPETLVFEPADFPNEDPAGKPLAAWAELDQLGIAAGHQAAKQASAGPWRGPALEILRVEWR